MKAIIKSKDKKDKIKKKIDKSKKKQVVVVAQEIKFARLLSGNEKKTRDRVLKALRKWILSCFEKDYDFKEDDFIRVWKGLFYAVWMSDKPLIQEELCENIAGILDVFPADKLQPALLMMKAGLRVLATEWFGIDHHRIDKFLMLVRRYLRGSLRCIQRCEWSEDACNQFADTLGGKDGVLAVKTPLYARNANSMMLHIADCYLEEIAKVSSGDLPNQSLCALLRPFLNYIAGGTVPTLCIASRRVLAQLIRYGEPEGGEDESGDESDEGGADDEEEAENDEENDSDDDETTGALDPRAGHVNVILPALPVPAVELVAILKQLLLTSSGSANRRTRRCIALLERFAGGEHPFAPEAPAVDTAPPLRPGKAARALRVLEKKLASNGDELALRGLSRKHRKRLLAKSRAGLSIVEDVAALASAGKQRTHSNGDWQIEETDGADKQNNKKKRKQADKENEVQNKKRKIEKINDNNAGKTQIKQEKKVDKKKQIKNGNIEEVKKLREKKSVNSVDNKNSLSEEVKKTKEKKSNLLELNNGDVEEVKSLRARKTTSVEVKNNVTGNKKKKDNILPEQKNVDIKNSDTKVNKRESKKNTKLDFNNATENAKDKSAQVSTKQVKKFEKQDKVNTSLDPHTPKKVKFVLKNNSMQGPVDYYKSVRQSPNIPFDSSKQPSKTNLKVSTPSPINPFFKKKLRLK